MYGHIDRLLVLTLQLATLKVFGELVSETHLRELALNVLVNFSIFFGSHVLLSAISFSRLLLASVALLKVTKRIYTNLSNEMLIWPEIKLNVRKTFINYFKICEKKLENSS